MSYVFYRAVNRIKKQRKRYLWLILQIVVGVGMLSTALNLTLSFHRQNRTYQEMAARPFVDLKVENAALKPSELDQLRKSGAILFYQYGAFEGCTKDYFQLFVDEPFYTQIMGMEDPPLGKVIAGKNAAALLDKDTSFVPLESLRYKAKTLLSDTVYTPDAIVPVSFDDYVIFPLNAVSQPPGLLHIAFLLDGGGQFISTKLNDIQAWLASSHPEGNYIISNYAQQVEETLSRNVVSTQLIQMLSAFIILIVFLGLTGLLLVLVNSRQRELAVSLMCGASYRQLMAEVFWEIFLVIAAGAVIGNLVCIPFLPMFSGFAVKTGYSFVTLIICVAGAAGLSLAVSAFAFRKITKIAPIMALKDL